jgi:Peptidase family C25
MYPSSTDLGDPAEARWGVIYAADEDEAVKQAVEPLIEHRAVQIGFDPSAFVYRPDSTAADFLARSGVSRGIQEFEKVPYYLLIVGGPAHVPFAFQSDLDFEYATGRLDFDTPNQYAAYVNSLIQYEVTDESRALREVLLWGAENGIDQETTVSANFLIQLLYDQLETPSGYSKRLLRGLSATRENLLSTLNSGEPPAVLVTSGHGLAYREPHSQQRSRQGALVAQGWLPGQPPQPGHLVTAADLDAAANLRGLVHYSFASFSAGTSSTAVIDPRQGNSASSSSFVAEFPRRLLALGAIAFVGHVGQVWGYPFLNAAQASGRSWILRPYRWFLSQLVSGVPVGYALRDLRLNSAMLLASLDDEVQDLLRGGGNLKVETLLQRWTASQNARSAVLLGDPAAQLCRQKNSKRGSDRQDRGTEPEISNSAMLPSITNLVRTDESTN